jgi:hypothetical protein
MILIKTVETPQDIFILGAYVNGKQETFSITDDYATFKLTNGNKSYYVDTDGFVFILTRSELLEYKDLIDENSYSQEGVLLKDFSGDMVLRMISTEGNDMLSAADFDPKEYVMYQRSNEEEYDDIVLELSEGTNMGKLMNIGDLLELL